MKPRNIILLLLLLGLALFITWRFIRPMNIFTVTDAFDRPVSTSNTPDLMVTLRADECAACHQDFYDEWRTTIHSQAWTDPYFQVDWRFDRSQQVCKNCHIPLDRQQEHIVLGFRDKARWDPILVPNPDFDPKLQHEGVTCAACHLRDGKIVGVLGIQDAPHPVQQVDDPNEMCVQCHVVEGDRWDTFFRFPPCGTVAEIQSNPRSRLTQDDFETLADHSGTLPEAPVTARMVTPSQPGHSQGKTGEMAIPDTASLGCVQCHMPLVERPLVAGGQVRPARQHLWRGGHDPAMVKQGLEVLFAKAEKQSGEERKFILTITNVGAAHYIPTGTPDRYLTVDLRLLDSEGTILKEQNHSIKRTIMWRPFIIDLWDTRLPRWQPRIYEFSVPVTINSDSTAVEAVVRYHLMDEKRRKRIGYENKEPIAYDVFRQVIPLAGFAREEEV
jgi:nitrate reductase cytochrome c-type subunit